MADTKATVWRYYLGKADGLKGWAVVYMEPGGLFTAQSSWGSFGHYWSHHGCKDFREFFLHPSAQPEKYPDHWAGKLCSHRRKYDGEKTLANIKRRVCRLRRDGVWGKATAAMEWEHLEDVLGEDLREARDLNEVDAVRWYDGTQLSDAAESMVYVVDPDAVEFVRLVMPLLINRFRAELAAEKSAQQAAGGQG